MRSNCQVYWCLPCKMTINRNYCDDGIWGRLEGYYIDIRSSGNIGNHLALQDGRLTGSCRDTRATLVKLYRNKPLNTEINSDKLYIRLQQNILWQKGLLNSVYRRYRRIYRLTGFWSGPVTYWKCSSPEWLESKDSKWAGQRSQNINLDTASTTERKFSKKVRN